MQIDTWFVIEGYHEHNLDYIYFSSLTKLSQQKQNMPDIELSFKNEKLQFFRQTYRVSTSSNDYEGDYD
jgi:hypothetical protein